MGRERLSAFSDGVIAIIITIMVLELKVPRGGHFSDLRPILPVFLSYTLSFVNVAIYWNNHHHLFFTTERVNGAILWANMHLLFWLSLIPFTTAWLGETRVAPAPTTVYGGVLLAAAIAYWLLQRSIISEHGPQSTLAAAVGVDVKGYISPALYLIAVVFAMFLPWVSVALYVSVALIWLVPDRRIERLTSGRSADQK